MRQTSLENRYKEFTKIHFLSDLPLDESLGTPVFYRYMGVENFIKSANNKNFAFMTPKCWEDPLEKRFWKTEYSVYGFKQPEIACLCVTTNANENSAGAWKMYRPVGDKKNDRIRLTIHVEEFFKDLNEWATTHKTDVYLCAANYDYGQEVIKTFHTNPDIFGCNFTLDDYLRLLCYKRPAFSFENEIRIFIIKPEDAEFENNGKLLMLEKFDIVNSVSRIMMEPVLPDYDVEWTKDKLIEQLKDFDKVEESRLYSDENCRPLKKLEALPPNACLEDSFADGATHRIGCKIENLTVTSENRVYAEIKGIGSFLWKLGTKTYNVFLANSDSSENLLQNCKTFEYEKKLVIEGMSDFQQALFLKCFVAKQSLTMDVVFEKKECLKIISLKVEK